MISRMEDKYRKEVVPALMKRFGWKNHMAVPKVKKVIESGGYLAAIGIPSNPL